MLAKSAIRAGIQGPVVQSIVNLTSLIEVKMLTFLVLSTMSNSQVFLLKKCDWLLRMQKPLNSQKPLTFFSKNISIYAIFNDQIFNDMITNDIISFEQLGPDTYFIISQ